MSQPDPSSTSMPALRGALLALLAALMFGISTPLVQRFGVEIGPFATAALLYAGAAVVGLLSMRWPGREARLTRGDLPLLLAVATAGAFVAPVALAWGLQRTSATSASLMLAFEAVFTALLAWRVYRETIGARVWLAMTMLAAGGAALILEQGSLGGVHTQGLLAVVLATAAWGLDNALSRALAQRDPSQVVLAKATLGAAASATLAIFAGEPAPSLKAAVALILIGASGYGLSLRFYLLAQRAFGAARTGSVFAFAPFIGAAFAVALGDRTGGWWMLAGGALMLLGVLLHLTETHAHEHEHQALEHEHAHRHDDGHHDHLHEWMPAGEHSHVHRHAPRRHSHPHVPDAHHGHRH